jgi:putative hydrolase of the HAD superfamily
MPISTLLIDLDDTLYPPTSGLWSLIRQRIDLYMHERLGLPWEIIPDLRRRLFSEYGTTMRGLQVTRQLDEKDYLAFVHDLPVEERLQPDPALASLLRRYPQRKVIFTNADEYHARRVLRALQMEGLFDDIIDICDIAPYCKPMPAAFSRALELAGVTLPGECLVCDDTPRNLAAARSLGCITVLVGSGNPSSDADYSILNLGALSQVLPPGAV